MPGGVVRASLVHYNTVEEIEQFGVALQEVARQLNPDGGDRR
jgi:selenocysteine lyase/cysteine desulfurase